MKSSFNLFLIAAVFISACSKKTDSTSNPGPIQNSPTVITFAGSGAAAGIDGTKQQAAFNAPTGIAINADGLMFVADKQNNAIRLLTPQGVVSTIAGTGALGFSNTKGAVTFDFPNGVAADNLGHVYVADQDNSTIRLIDIAAGATSSFAGNGRAGYINASDTAARFNVPAGVAIDALGNIYVADNGNNVIRKITSKGGVTTLAGSGKRGSANATGLDASFNQPQALAVDANGNVFVADEGNNLIRKITPAGVVTTVAGTGGRGNTNGIGTAASFDGPAGIAVDDKGNIYVGDSNNNLIRKIAPDRTVTTVAGTGVAGHNNGALSAATFNSPQGLVVDRYGRIFVTDTGNNMIRMITQ